MISLISFTSPRGVSATRVSGQLTRSAALSSSLEFLRPWRHLAIGPWRQVRGASNIRVRSVSGPWIHGVRSPRVRDFNRPTAKPRTRTHLPSRTQGLLTLWIHGLSAPRILALLAPRIHGLMTPRTDWQLTPRMYRLLMSSWQGLRTSRRTDKQTHATVITNDGPALRKIEGGKICLRKDE